MNKASISKEDLTLTHLESQLNAALGLHSVKEYKFWLMTYTRYLVENSMALHILLLTFSTCFTKYTYITNRLRGQVDRVVQLHARTDQLAQLDGDHSRNFHSEQKAFIVHSQFHHVMCTIVVDAQKTRLVERDVNDCGSGLALPAILHLLPPPAQRQKCAKCAQQECSRPTQQCATNSQATCATCNNQELKRSSDSLD